MNDKIIIKGAKEHNLKNINLEIPRDKMVVITGLSGSGKSSLAFDTLYAEGQRRYVESLSSYARQFLGLMEKPDVERIDGLSPAISIDQKTTSKNPRSTVGTVTEIYDYIRLLYARIGVPYCPNCHKKIEKQTIDQIVDNIMSLDEGTKIQVLAPVVRGRKGEYTKQLEGYQKEGFVRVRIDGENYELSDDIEIDRKKKHEIELVVDRLVIRDDITSRLTESVEVALKHADNLVLIDIVGKNPILYSCNYACPDCGFSFPELTPRMFSFNNPFGACPECTGIGYLMKMDEDLIVPDKNKTLYDGIKAFGSSTMKKGDTMAKMYFESIGKHYGINIKNKKIKDLPRWFMEKILYGTGDEEIEFEYTSYAGTRNFTAPFEGVLPTLDRRHNETKSQGMRDFYEMYMTNSHCPACNGARLKPEILSIKVGDKNINELTEMSIRKIKEYLNGLKLNKTQAMISELILKEIDQRLQFLIDVGLEYLTLSRNAGSLSGGESQRIRLATQIGSGLTGVLYILDEPSIGLHQRDNEKLLATLKKLRDLGNTLLVVEHDEDTMRASDFIVDIGAHRQHILADRAFAPQHRVVVDARIVPDPCRFPRPGIVGIGLVDQKPAVSQHRIPILGIVRPNPVARTAVRIKFVFRDAVPLQLTGIGVADGRALVLPHEPIVVVEIGDAVVAEADIEADERARTLISVDHDTDVGHRKAVARIAPVLRGVALAAREGHHRRDRNVAVAVHAQPRRVDRHRREVGAQRGESPRHGHGARRAEVELRLREFDHIGRHQQVLVHQKSAPLLSRSPGRRRGGRKRDYQSFHSRLHIKKVNR